MTKAICHLQCSCQKRSTPKIWKEEVPTGTISNCSSAGDFLFCLDFGAAWNLHANLHAAERARIAQKTALKPPLSILMANLGRIGDGDLVCDPYCGGGSIFVGVRRLGLSNVYLGGDVNLEGPESAMSSPVNKTETEGETETESEEENKTQQNNSQSIHFVKFEPAFLSLKSDSLAFGRVDRVLPKGMEQEDVSPEKNNSEDEDTRAFQARSPCSPASPSSSNYHGSPASPGQRTCPVAVRN